MNDKDISSMVGAVLLFTLFSCSILIFQTFLDGVEDTQTINPHDMVVPICPDATLSANGKGVTYYLHIHNGTMVEAIESVGMGLIECTVDPEGNYVRLGGIGE